MKRKPSLLALAAVLVAGGLWLTRPAWRGDASPNSSTVNGATTPDGQIKATHSNRADVNVGDPMVDGQPDPTQIHRPPDQSRIFTDFTPEQRVEFMRKGHGPGG